MQRIRLATLLVAGLSLAAPRAHANGALPKTIEVLLPEAAPKTIVVSTNFGLITSTDEGASWRWTCEHDLGEMGSAYQMGAPPKGQLLALANAGLVQSNDLACGWSLVMDETTAIPQDYFPDPSDPTRVLVLGILRSQQQQYAVLQLKLAASGPAAITTLYTPKVGDQLTTVEVARSNAQIAYATLRSPDGVSPARVARTADGGKTWVESTPDPMIIDMGILAVDATDPNKLYFRVRNTDGDELQISSDGGKTLKKALAPMLVMSAFVQESNGHVLVGWLDIDRGYIDRSSDGGVTFMRLDTQLHAQSLAERGGKLYMATDFLVDDFALAMSTDDGQTWKQAMSINDIVASDSCAASSEVCASWCQQLVSRFVFMPKVCGNAAAATDGGAARDAAAAADAQTGGPGKDAATQGGPGKGGCACAVGSGTGRPGGWMVLLATALVLRRRRR